ncbi:unnamed protein product [Phyllotreta striolata]|uniref:Uncharacterized protein n=1 Tax=Phyllotreta striolata TaxID=444603 RepID=A0A9N9TZR6_PHYSR|nr:unnamed protein product [Phyllotreta striolata]
MNLIMGRRQTKRQEPQCGPLHHQQQQQQQSQNKHTPPPPPPPPPPPCADDSWELQYCKWWGWNWVKKDRSEMNKYAAPSPCEGPTRDNLPPVRCPAMPIKRVDKNNNRFKDFCNCLFSPNRKTAESLQRLYSTPSNSLIYESLCCGNQERGLDSYTCMELRNRSNKNTPNKRSKDKICKCPQEQEKKEKRKKHCTCKDSISSLSNGCNCKEKEPPKKGCNCKESKVNAMRACNFKDSNSELPPQMCCNCKDSNNNLIKKCCECNETNCPKKCCCGCMEPSNVARKCCGCPPNPSNAVNCCGCPKKSEEEDTITYDCPCQTKPETKCSPCQTVKTNMCECLKIPEKCTCCCHCNCFETKPIKQPKCRRYEADEEDEEFTCAICKARENKSLYSFEEEPKRVEKKENPDLRESISQQSARKIGMFSYYIPRYNQILTKNQEIMVKQDIQSSWNHPKLLLPPEEKRKFHEEHTSFAFTRENCQHCKWTQTIDHSRPACTPDCPCTWCKPSPIQCINCPWTKVDFPFKHSSAQTINPTNYHPPVPFDNKPFAPNRFAPNRFAPNLPCPYCSFNSSMCTRADKEEAEEPDALEEQLPYDLPPIEKTTPEQSKKVSIGSKAPRNPSREAVQRRSTGSNPREIEPDFTRQSVDQPAPPPEPSPQIPPDFSTRSIAPAPPPSVLPLSVPPPSAPPLSVPQLQKRTLPTSDSIIDFARIRHRPFTKSRVLPRPQAPVNKYHRIKNSPSDILSKYYDISLNDSDLRTDYTEYTDYVNDIESKIVKKLKSRLLLDVFSSVLESVKKEIVSVDEESLSSDSTETDRNQRKRTTMKAINKLLRETNDRKVTTGPKQKKRRGSPVKIHPEKKFKHIDANNTDSSEEESAVDNLYEKIDKITKESRSNVAKLQEAVNSLSRSKEVAHHGRKNRQLVNKLYEIVQFDEDAVQHIDLSKQAERERAKRSGNLFENNGLSENWSGTSFDNDKPDYIHAKPTTSSYPYDKDSTRRYEKNSKLKSKSKIPVKKRRPN